ncbi:hypothetical protein Bca4012_025656 [Brassica carinata]
MGDKSNPPRGGMNLRNMFKYGSHKVLNTMATHTHYQHSATNKVNVRFFNQYFKTIQELKRKKVIELIPKIIYLRGLTMAVALGNQVSTRRTHIFRQMTCGLVKITVSQRPPNV